MANRPSPAIFVALPDVLRNPLVAAAGFWDWLTGGDNSPAGESGCTFSHTQTKCIAVTQWCKHVWACGWNPNSLTPMTKDSGWFICGACFGFDW